MLILLDSAKWLVIQKDRHLKFHRFTLPLLGHPIIEVAKPARQAGEYLTKLLHLLTQKPFTFSAPREHCTAAFWPSHHYHQCCLQEPLLQVCSNVKPDANRELNTTKGSSSSPPVFTPVDILCNIKYHWSSQAALIWYSIWRLLNGNLGSNFCGRLSWKEQHWIRQILACDFCMERR